MKKIEKPLGHKSYGSIGHLPGSKKIDRKDKGLNDAQVKICTSKVRDEFDNIVVQEKIDGTNVSIARINDDIVPLMRAGYRAIASRYEVHRHFHNWAFNVIGNSFWMNLLKNGERLCGDWLMQVHGIKYDLDRSPFVVFDIMDNNRDGIHNNHHRLTWDKVNDRLSSYQGEAFSLVPTLTNGNRAISIQEAMKLLGENGHYGAHDMAEGCVWRAEKKGEVDFLAKYVRPEFEAGKYLFEKKSVWNITPAELFEK